MNDTRREGGCRCGAIRYELVGEPLFTHACHCTDCQKRGGPFGLSMLVEEGQVRLLQGAPVSVEVVADSGRSKSSHFCRSCGTAVWGRSAARPGLLVLRPNTLDDTSWFVPQAHIWTRSKQPWVSLPAGVPAFETVYDARELWPEASLARLRKPSR